MDTSNLAVAIAKSANTTSDSGAYKLHSHMKACNMGEELLREYVYFKAFLGILKLELLADKVKEASNNGNYKGDAISDVRDLNSTIPAVYELLNRVFQNDIFGYGNTVIELKQRVEEYKEMLADGVPLDDLFYECLEKNVDYFGVLDYGTIRQIQTEGMNYMDKAFVTGSSGKTAAKGGGCLSVVACTILFIVGVVCLF